MNKLILLIIYLATGLFLYSRNGPVASGIFFLLCLPLYFLYNSFEKRQYRRHFTKFINTYFKENLGKPATIELGENNFHVVDDEDNWHVYEDVEEIMEINSMVIIQLKKGVAILLPKNKIENAASFLNELNRITESRNILKTKDLDWKWK